MRTVLADVKAAVDANDAAKTKTQADSLEEAWAKFEDAVKAKDKTAYSNIEEPHRGRRQGEPAGSEGDEHPDPGARRPAGAAYQVSDSKRTQV